MRRILLGLALVAVFSTACGVVPYRGVQRDFEDAVARDNEATVSSAFIDPATGYQDVFGTLSPDYIRGSGRKSLKEQRLRPNAWMLRAVSAWRLKDYSEATKAAEAGLALEPMAGSRDAVILEMIPALTRHSEITDLWVASERSFTREQYDAQRDNLAAAYRAMSNLRTTEATPDGSLYYVYYQQWRLLQNWRQIIADVKDPTDADQIEMQRWVTTNVLGGLKMGAAADAKREKIPTGHALRKLIAAQESSR